MEACTDLRNDALYPLHREGGLDGVYGWEKEAAKIEQYPGQCTSEHGVRWPPFAMVNVCTQLVVQIHRHGSLYTT